MSRRKLEKEAAALVAEAWALYRETGNPNDERLARMIAEMAEQPTEPPKKTPTRASREAEKQRIRQRSSSIDPNSPILAQVRNLVR